MKYTIYKTTNNINGKFYYGKHQTNNPNDNYLGSGVLLEKAIKKYGKEHFHKEVLFIFDSEEEMNQKEKEIITEQLISDPQCYNMTYGGEGGDTWTFYGRKHSEETKQKLREIQLNNLKDPEYHNKMVMNFQKALKAMKENDPERYQTMIRKRAATLSRKLKECPRDIKNKTKQKISVSMKKYYDLHGRKNPPRIKREIKFDGPVSGKKTRMTNGTKEIGVYIEEIEWYESHGWKVGGSPQRKKATGEKMNAASGKGKFIVHNKQLQSVKRINPEELETYLNAGWERGYLHKHSKSKV